MTFTHGSASPHWAIEYIGKPWLPGGRGPDAFDCWGLVWWIYKHRYGVELPAYPIHPANILAVAREMDRQQGHWKRLKEPVEGCLVAMSRNLTHFHHVGLFLADQEGGRVLHAFDCGAVLAQPLHALVHNGWTRVEFYQYNP